MGRHTHIHRQRTGPPRHTARRLSIISAAAAGALACAFTATPAQAAVQPIISGSSVPSPSQVVALPGNNLAITGSAPGSVNSGLPDGIWTSTGTGQNLQRPWTAPFTFNNGRSYPGSVVGLHLSADGSALLWHSMTYDGLTDALAAPVSDLAHPLDYTFHTRHGGVQQVFDIQERLYALVVITQPISGRQTMSLYRLDPGGKHVLITASGGTNVVTTPSTQQAIVDCRNSGRDVRVGFLNPSSGTFTYQRLRGVSLPADPSCLVDDSGRYAVVAVQRRHTPLLAVLSRGHHTLIPGRGGSQPLLPEFTPHSTQVTALGTGRLVVFDARSPKRRKTIRVGQDPLAVEWSPRGDLAAVPISRNRFESSGNIATLVRLFSSRRRRFVGQIKLPAHRAVTPGGRDYTGAQTNPDFTFTPDGARIIFSVSRFSGNPHRKHSRPSVSAGPTLVASSRGSEMTPLGTTGVLLGSIAFSADGASAWIPCNPNTIPSSPGQASVLSLSSGDLGHATISRC